MEVKGSECGLTSPKQSQQRKASRHVIPLDKEWVFRDLDSMHVRFLPVAQFPTNVHIDLMYHNLIPDPFIGKNENAVQWVGEKCWIYKTTFPSPVTNGSSTVLAFDGLDTHATVFLNDKKILGTENMFIPERVDVSRLLKSGSQNVLEIVFGSTWLVGQKLVEKYPKHRWGCWNGDPSRLAVRKAQYHYGWDWGPTLLTCGPWKPINLEIYVSRISDLYFTTKVEKSLRSAEVIAKADIEGSAESVKFEITLSGTVVSKATVSVVDGHATATFRTQSPELWYPARYGKQPLYRLSATLVSGGNELDHSYKRFGLRRAELVQKGLEDVPGTSFFFKINNIPIFCGGSNWIPADSFLPRISPERYKDWVKVVVEGNQVMMRVWGGGIYEHQALYEACDEMGVLVWQDFLFACGNYPTSEDFLASVKREATENVKALRHHPSIVIWAGNNEDYQYMESESLEYDPEDKDPQSWLKSTWPARYIYEKLLLDITKELIPDTYYHFGSPFGGNSTIDDTMGDIHQWNVWHGTQEKYQSFDKLTGRFVSEFGMEAFPNVKTIDGYLPNGNADAERYSQSSTIDFHNKAAGHERRIALYLAENIRYNPENLEHFIYQTQLIQAECLSTAYKLWRRQWQGPGREYCAGALVWQINDCWPVTSWSIVDYYLRPKLAYYAVKRELSPIAISMKRRPTSMSINTYTSVNIKTSHKIETWASNLSLERYDHSYVELKAWDVVTGKRKVTDNTPKSVTEITLEPNRSVEITDFEVPVEQENVEEELQTVVAAYLWGANHVLLARCVNWPEPLKYVHLQKPKDLRVRALADGKILEISAEVPVKGVALSCEDESVKFLDNYIDLVPDEKVKVEVEGLRRGDVGKIQVRYLN